MAEIKAALLGPNHRPSSFHTTYILPHDEKREEEEKSRRPLYYFREARILMPVFACSCNPTHEVGQGKHQV